MSVVWVNANVRDRSNEVNRTLWSGGKRDFWVVIGMRGVDSVGEGLVGEDIVCRRDTEVMKVEQEDGD
jgi:hypothetical protein